MSAKQTSMLLGRFVEHQTHFHALSTSDAQWAIQNPKDAAGLCVKAIRSRENGTPSPKRTYALLQPLTPLASEPTTFNADDTFFNKKSGVKMVEHGSNFSTWFAGKVEENVEPARLVSFKLTKDAYDSDIVKELGGEDAAEVNLIDVWRLLERQPNGGDGALLVNGYANIFYVRDREGVLRAVDVRWRGVGWNVSAPVLWAATRVGGGGHRVFSRNS